jgi:rare lipoprotein A
MKQGAWKLYLTLICLLFWHAGCQRHATHTRVSSYPPPPPPPASPASPAAPARLESSPAQINDWPREETEGMASWYGYPYHGRHTTSGEVYDMNTLTAAHRTLPFNTLVAVHNLDNGKDVQVRINDRGPFVDGRVIDLSLAAARKIELVGPGTARVKLEILNRVAVAQLFAIQIGAFKEKANAERLVNRLAAEWQAVQTHQVEDDRGLFYRVFVGRFPNYSQAMQALQKLRSQGNQGYIVRLDPEIH